MRLFRFVFCWLALACGMLAADERPNIVFILADDLGFGDLSCYGGKTPTPNLDRLAAEGTRFMQAYVASPICSPSRAALITGQYPGRWRITSYLQTRKGNAACEQVDFLNPKAPSLPRELKKTGYRTAHVGKWHLGGGRDVTNAPPFSAYGYDVGLGTYESPEPHPDITGTNWIWSAHDKVKRWNRTAWMVDRTLEFVKRSKESPAFVNLWLDDTHTPWVPSEEATDDRRRDTQPKLREVLVEMDRQLGRMIEEIRAWGTNRATLLVFMGDNGPLPTFAQARTGGLRGAKLSLYEGGIREPLIAWWPGKIPTGRVNEKTVVSSLDFFPTFLEVAGAKTPEGTFDGKSIASTLFGAEPIRSGALFWEYGRNTNSFAFPGDPRNRSPNVAMREGDWKLLVRADGTGAELYDLEADRNEQTNLAEAQPERAKRMSEATLRWRKALP